MERGQGETAIVRIFVECKSATDELTQMVCVPAPVLECFGHGQLWTGQMDDL